MSSHLLCIAVLLLLIGCKKAETTNAPVQPSTIRSAATNDTEPAPAANDPAQLAAAISDLTQQVRKFAVEQRRAPKSLNDLVQSGYLSSIPVAPPGKKFAINKNLQVYVADQ